jgi:hypothetical protein
MKKLLIAAGFVLAATSASLARDHGYYGAPYGYGPYGDGSGVNVYDNAPGGAYISGDPYSGGPLRQQADGW